MTETIQVAINGHPSLARLLNNNILCEEPGQLVVFASTEKKEYTLEEYQRTYQQWAASNIEAVPQFVNPPKPPSPKKSDADIPETRTVSAGKGKVMEVADVSEFFDARKRGACGARLRGDYLKVADADLITNEITVDRETSWTKGEIIKLDLNGEPPVISMADFRLKPDSPCIDAGGPLTKTRTVGKGKTVEVEDALYFCDGYGIVEPDVIRVGAERVKVAAVDYEKNRLTVDRSIAWTAGAPVSLDHAGKAPDIGAFEFGMESAPK